MRRTSFNSAALIAIAGVALGGCSAFENLGGAKKVSPDEFKIVSHSPLTMPPNAELRPPRPEGGEMIPIVLEQELLQIAVSETARAEPFLRGGGHIRRCHQTKKLDG